MKKAHKKRTSTAPASRQPRAKQELSEEQLERVAGGATSALVTTITSDGGTGALPGAAGTSVDATKQSLLNSTCTGSHFTEAKVGA
jgi:hypothetical protein